MAGIAKIASALSGNLGDAFAKVVAVFKVPPEQVEQHAFELEKIQEETKQKVLTSAAIEIQGATEIIKQEAASQSWLPRNVRPLLLLLWGLCITFNLFIPMVARYWIPDIQPLPLDPWVYKLVAIGYTGYVAFRTAEKITDKDN